MKILFVGGDFNDRGGKPSGYFKKFCESFESHFELDEFEWFWDVNGGYFSKLEEVMSDKDFSELDIIFWFANVPNNKEKIIRDVKKLAPKCMLVTSKANYDGSYTIQDLVGRALENKANLLVEFSKLGSTVISRLIDPLGNEWCHTSDIDDLTKAIYNRLMQLRKFTRIGSRQIGDAIETPKEEFFFEIIRNCADKFHELIHGANTSRFLGNASFRCTNGFPSMRKDNLVFVSKRNIDKRELGENGFVACDLNSLKCDSKVLYYGDHKPSVDTPIQLALYNYYKNINFMVHSHCYVDKAPFTREKVPCGAIEEVSEITSVYPWKDAFFFAINLKGHGSIIAASTPAFIHSFSETYIARPWPEGDYVY